MNTFGYTCEGCHDILDITHTAYAKRCGQDNGRFRCDECRAKTPKWGGNRRKPPHLRQRQGCIVTTSDDRVHYRNGLVLEALREIIDTLPDGAHIESISTEKSILGDVTRPKKVDPWAYERELLGKIGRLDMLPPAAKVWGQVAA